MSIVLLLPVLYALQMFFESGWIKNKLKFILEATSAALAGLYFYTLPDSSLTALHFSRFFLFLTISFLFSLICIKEHISNDAVFWHFHAILFSRLNLASLYTSVILGGSAAALGAIDTLFSTKLLANQEIRIVILTLWLFTPLFFLSGVPLLSNRSEITSYKPKWIKNIGLYVLLPLSSVYLLILYAYMGKISFLWRLPDGMVSYLVLSFAAFGILSLIVIFPFQKDENYRWSYWFGRLFYFLQFPLLILLGIAIYRRVTEYGITFRRYYVVALAFWLLSITVFMIVRKNRNLIVIPLSLFLLAVLSASGPWSAFNLSFLNQKSRLMKILEDNALLQSGKLVKTGKDLPGEVKADICSITKYLYDYGNLGKLAVLSNTGDSLTPQLFVAQMGFEWEERWQWQNRNKDYFHYSLPEGPHEIRSDGFDALVNMNIASFDTSDSKVLIKEIEIEYRRLSESFLFLSSNGDSAVLQLKDVISSFEKRSGKNNNTIGYFPFENDHFAITGIFDNLSGNKDSGKITVNSVKVMFLIKRK